MSHRIRRPWKVAPASPTVSVRALLDFQRQDESKASVLFSSGFAGSGPDAGWTELMAYAAETIGE